MSPERPKPISPKEVTEKKLETMPDVVIETFNELIARSGDRHAVVRQSDVVAILVMKGLKREEIFENGWLDVEDIYRKAGWTVEYDKPGYNESYEPTFTFSPKRTTRRD